MAELFPCILLDIVDDEWLFDKLPHDDIPFPPGVAPPADEIDESSTRLQSLLSRDPYIFIFRTTHTQPARAILSSSFLCSSHKTVILEL
ncbi:unnamed protein product [Sphagnum balticum]